MGKSFYYLRLINVKKCHAPRYMDLFFIESVLKNTALSCCYAVGAISLRPNRIHLNLPEVKYKSCKRNQLRYTNGPQA